MTFVVTATDPEPLLDLIAQGLADGVIEYVRQVEEPAAVEAGAA